MNSEEPRHHVKVPLAPHFASTEISVDCPEPAESLQGEMSEIEADKKASTCERKHVTYIQQCHIRQTPWHGGDKADLLNFFKQLCFFVLQHVTGWCHWAGA